MLVVYRAAGSHPIEKVITSPSPSGRGVGVRAGEPPATVPPKPNPFALKHRYSGNKPPESLVVSGNGLAFHHTFDQNSQFDKPLFSDLFRLFDQLMKKINFEMAKDNENGRRR